MKKIRLWAIKIRYLESQYDGDGKWHQHTTSWHSDSNSAWQEAEEYQNQFNYNWIECGSSLLRKEV